MTGTKYMNLQWNDFQDNAKSLFQSLRNDSSFTDVTLACNGIQIEVHKVILCGSSPFFTSILKAKPSHPLIYLRGIKAENLVSIVDFIYNGQVNVLEENLNEFLDVAEEFKLKGLMREKPEVIESNIEEAESENRVEEVTFVTSDRIKKEDKLDTFNKESTDFESGKTRRNARKSNVEFQGGLDDLDAKLKSMMERVSKVWTCKVCGKTTGKVKDNLKKHVENKHIEGVSYPCDRCDQKLKSRTSLNFHNYRFHSTKPLEEIVLQENASGTSPCSDDEIFLGDVDYLFAGKDVELSIRLAL